MTSSEIIFEVREDEVEGGFNAQALGHDIFTQADSVEELRTMVKDALGCHFGRLRAVDTSLQILVPHNSNP